MANTFLFTGSWNIPFRGMSSEGDGIHVFRLSPDSGVLTPAFHYQTKANTSILALHPSKPVLYATDEQRNHGGIEGAGGGVLALSVDPVTGALEERASRPTYAACTSYVDVDATGRLLAFSNHGSTQQGCYQLSFRQRADGSYETYRVTDRVSVGVYALDAAGMPADTPTLFPLDENGAHFHSVMFSPSNRWLLACDKGTDKICVYRVDAANRRILPATPPHFQLQAHIAPRHIVFRPGTPFFYVCNELGYTVSSYQLHEQSGEIVPIAQRPTMPVPLPDDVGGTADLHINGSFLYVSTRFRDPSASACHLSIYALDRAGEMELVDYVPLRGKNPRGFRFSPDGRYLFVGDMNSHTITRFAVDQSSGQIGRPEIAAEVNSPSCIQIGVFEQAT